MSLSLLTDDDVRAVLTPEVARSWMRAALRAHTFGELSAPARTDLMIGDRRLRLTAGEAHHTDAGWFGFRSYLAPGKGTEDEVTVVADERSGRVRGIHVGAALAPRRCGAVGAIAVEALTAPDARTVGLVGTGRQAWHQLWALSGMRAWEDITVYSRDPARREDFAARARDELGLPVRAVGGAREAVQDRPIVVLATHSSTPVIEASWPAPGAYLATVGPKQIGHHEFGLDVLPRIGVAVTDSVSQVSSYSPPHLLTTTADPPCLLSLGEVLWRGLPEIDGIRGAGDLTTFFSVGLGGSEAYLLARMLEAGPPR